MSTLSFNSTGRQYEHYVNTASHEDTTSSKVGTIGTTLYTRTPDRKSGKPLPKSVTWKPPTAHRVRGYGLADQGLYNRVLWGSGTIDNHANLKITYYPFVAPEGVSGFPVDDVTAVDLSYLEGPAILSALSKLKDNNVNYALSFLQREKTVETIASSAYKLVGFLSALKHLNLPKACQALGVARRHKRLRQQNLRRTFLELQYGWRPVLNDAYGAFNDLVHADKLEPNRYSVSVTGTRQQPFYASGQWTTGDGFKYSRSGRAMFGSFVRFDFTQSNPMLAYAQFTGVSNPLNLAWQLLPFSFVADWFLPIGQYLNGLDATLGLSLRGGSKSNMLNGNYVWLGSTYSSSGVTYTCNASMRASFFDYSRTTYSSVPYPSFLSVCNIKHTGLVGKLTHLASGLALLGEVCKGLDKITKL